MLQVWVGDGLVPADEAVVSVYDRGFRSGEGVFETLRAYGVHPFRLAAHLDRATAGAHALGFDLPARDLLEEAVRTTASANIDHHAGHDSAVRLTLTPGVLDPEAALGAPAAGHPTVVVTSHPLADDAAAARDGVEATAVPWSRELPDVKSVSYLSAAQARRRARELGVHEALLTDTTGHVLEGSFSNVFAVRRGRLRTPPTSAGILAGVTRGVVLEVAAALGLPVDEEPLTLEELVRADEAFLTASTRELIPLVRVTGRTVGDGRPGPVTAALHEGYRDEVRRESLGVGGA